MKKLKFFIILGISVLLLVMMFFSFIYKGSLSTIKVSSSLMQDELVERGAYLARMGNCLACHSDPTDKGPLTFAGGHGFSLPIGMVYGTNITPDKATGIGQYSLRDFDNAVRYGVRKDGNSLYPAMPYPDYAAIKDDDIEALYAYFMNGVTPIIKENKSVDVRWPLSMRWPLAAWRMMFAPQVESQAMN